MKVSWEKGSTVHSTKEKKLKEIFAKFFQQYYFEETSFPFLLLS